MRAYAKKTPDGGWGGSSVNSKPKVDGFSELTRNDHFERHGYEYGAKTPDEYEKLAIELKNRASSDDIRQFISKDGFLFKYDVKNKDFLIAKPSGEIVTLYKPTNKLNYWEGQVLKYGTSK
jgi:pyocin large subunit-like protein